jgi:large subunit ribosomal protein L24
MFKRLKIKKGDLVVVTSGDNKGKQGRVSEVDRASDRVIVEGLNMVTKHRKPSAARWYRKERSWIACV